MTSPGYDLILASQPALAFDLEQIPEIVRASGSLDRIVTELEVQGSGDALTIRTRALSFLQDRLSLLGEGPWRNLPDPPPKGDREAQRLHNLRMGAIRNAYNEWESGRHTKTIFALIAAQEPRLRAWMLVPLVRPYPGFTSGENRSLMQASKRLFEAIKAFASGNGSLKNVEKIRANLVAEFPRGVQSGYPRQVVVLGAVVSGSPRAMESFLETYLTAANALGPAPGEEYDARRLARDAAKDVLGYPVHTRSGR